MFWRNNRRFYSLAVDEEGHLGQVLVVLVVGMLVQSSMHPGDLAFVPEGCVQPTTNPQKGHKASVAMKGAGQVPGENAE